MSIIFVSERFFNQVDDPDFSYMQAKLSAASGENVYLFNIGTPLPKIGNDLLVVFPGFSNFFSRGPFRYFLSSLFLLIHLIRNPYDKVVFFSPVILQGGLFASLIPSRSSIEIFLFDFFPIDNFKVKGLRFGFLYRFFLMLESFVINRASSITVMHSTIVSRAREYYSISDSIPVHYTYLNSSRSFSCHVLDNAQDRSNYIFSGHLSPGRGIEQLVDCFNLAVAKGALVKLYVCGDGPVLAYLSGPGVEYLGSHNKDSVCNLVHSLGCVAGIVSLYCDDLLSCFPSKSLDYLSMGIPIVSISSFSHALSHDIDYFDIGVNLNWNEFVDFLCDESTLDRLHSFIPNIEPYYSSYIYKEI